MNTIAGLPGEIKTRTFIDLVIMQFITVGSCCFLLRLCFTAQQMRDQGAPRNVILGLSYIFGERNPDLMFVDVKSYDKCRIT